mgnify:CR=1 FL=1
MYQLNKRRLSWYNKIIGTYPCKRIFVGNKTNYVVPEAKIEIVDDELTVTLNEEAIPKIKINSSYKSTNSLSIKIICIQL